MRLGSCKFGDACAMSHGGGREAQDLKGEAAAASATAGLAPASVASGGGIVSPALSVPIVSERVPPPESPYG